jgi:uncharacterized BrkB/YihY/UPF0761 family membrane protein
MGLSDIPGLLKDTALAWYADRGPRLGAVLAFYTLFSLAPLLIIVVAVAALAFGRELAQTQLAQQIEAVVGVEGARVIQSTIENTSRSSSGISAASVYGTAGSLVILLMWIYYSAQILYAGAEFTKASTQRRGRKITPHEAEDGI